MSSQPQPDDGHGDHDATRSCCQCRSSRPVIELPVSLCYFHHPNAVICVFCGTAEHCKHFYQRPPATKPGIDPTMVN
jgi:hypothetical protein